MPSGTHCPFCDIDPGRVVAHNDAAFAIRDAFPVSEGHTLVLPRRHVADWWAATPQERVAIDALVQGCKEALDEQYAPAGYNIGVNNGTAAGQTVYHLHVHLIPRYDGDTPDPRGGVRHVLPGRGNYLAADSPGERTASRIDPGTLLQRILGLLDEGRRSATYKPALLLALTELAVERAQGAAALSLPLRDVAERVMELYWPQTRPYPAGDIDVLKQGAGARVRIPDALERLRSDCGATPGTPLARVRWSQPAAYEQARHAVMAALAKQPVPRLQRPGTTRGLDAYPRFLYDDSRYAAERGALDPDPVITLRPGVAESLARDAGLIRIAAHDAWVQGVAGFNGLRLDEADLHDFLFGTDRRSLRLVAEGLRDGGATACFWCARPLGSAVEVDHVIPWSHYSHDDLSNLVLTDQACNNDKRDRLVTAELVHRWLDQDLTGLRAIAGQLRWPFEPGRSHAVARSSYRNLAEGMPVWRGRRDVVLFDGNQRAAIMRLLDSATGAA
jgi:diadenosine tetraphosphate (Ap4A) HIT family hydrolase